MGHNKCRSYRTIGVIKGKRHDFGNHWQIFEESILSSLQYHDNCTRRVATLYQDNIFKEHRLPKVISDRGPQFISNFMKELYKKLGIEPNPSTTYHLQTDGQTERVNQELEEYLRIYVNEWQNNWVDWLPIAQFCHNDRQHLATGYSLFMITGGRHPFKGIFTDSVGKAAAQDNGLSERRILTGLLLLKSSRS